MDSFDKAMIAALARLVGRPGAFPESREYRKPRCVYICVCVCVCVRVCTLLNRNGRFLGSEKQDEFTFPSS